MFYSNFGYIISKKLYFKVIEKFTKYNSTKFTSHTKNHLKQSFGRVIIITGDQLHFLMVK